MRKLIFLAGMLPFSAFAGDLGGSIADQARGCWNMPPHAGDNAVVDFDVTLSAKGRVDDIAFIAGGDADRQTVLSASAAIERCAPYQMEAGTVRVRLSAEAMPKPLDPFKPRPAPAP